MMCNTDIGHISYWRTMWSAVAKMKAIEARLEGMKAENTIRDSRGEAAAWDSTSFEEMANDLDAIAEWLCEGK